MTATWAGRDAVSPARRIDFTITVPSGYRLPIFFLLAYTFFTPACALDSGPVLVNGFLLTLGHFA